jgi:hypothetical protein
MLQNQQQDYNGHTLFVRGDAVCKYISDVDSSSLCQKIHPSFFWILALTLLVVSETSGSRVTVFPVKDFTKICIVGGKAFQTPMAGKEPKRRDPAGSGA